MIALAQVIRIIEGMQTFTSPGRGQCENSIHRQYIRTLCDICSMLYFSVVTCLYQCN